MSSARRLAFLLTRHARGILPETGTRWGDAMERETQYMDNDRDALSWAVGCVIAAYAARIRSVEVTIPWTVRLLLAVWCLVHPLIHFYRLSLFALCPLFDNPECLAHINPWPFALSTSADILYLLAGLRLLRNRPTAFAPYAAALLLHLASHAYSFVFQASGAFAALARIFGSSGSSFDVFRISRVNPYELTLTALVLPLVLGLAIWLIDRHPPATARKVAQEP